MCMFKEQKAIATLSKAQIFPDYKKVADSKN